MVLKEITTHRPSSFHGVTIRTTPDKLMRLWDAAGLDYYDGNTGDDKTNFDFGAQVGDLQFFVYDWKYYRPLAIHTEYTFNIGAEDYIKSVWAADILENLLAKL